VYEPELVCFCVLFVILDARWDAPNCHSSPNSHEASRPARTYLSKFAFLMRLESQGLHNLVKYTLSYFLQSQSAQSGGCRVSLLLSPIEADTGRTSIYVLPHLPCKCAGVDSLGVPCHCHGWREVN
jgi:hypothetical protein